MLDGDKFKEVLKNTPLVALDLLIMDSQGCVLLGLRNNEPGKGFWSVPGGRIYKDETLKEAFKRISKNELGFSIDMGNVSFGGIYEHFYNENFFQAEGIKTHYVTIGCKTVLTDTSKIMINSQHTNYAFFEISKLLEAPEVLENTKRFFDGQADDLFLNDNAKVL